MLVYSPFPKSDKGKETNTKNSMAAQANIKARTISTAATMTTTKMETVLPRTVTKDLSSLK